MISKTKLIRLKGQALRDLVARVFDRDQHRCVYCLRWVEDGVKPHHEPCGAGRKSDELGKMVLLCNECHYERHHGKESPKVKEKVEQYLEWMQNEV